MSAAQLERLAEQMQRLKLVRTALELPLLLQDASKRELPYSDLLEESLQPRAGRQAGASYGDEDDDGALSLSKEPRQLRLQIPTLH